MWILGLKGVRPLEHDVQPTFCQFSLISSTNKHEFKTCLIDRCLPMYLALPVHAFL